MLRKISSLIKLTLLLGILALGVTAYYCFRPLGMAQKTVDFEILPGDTMRVISRRVADAGIDVWPPAVTGLARVLGRASSAKAGSYRVDKPVTTWELVALLTSGANAYADVTLVEGWTFSRVRATLNAHPDLNHETLVLSDAEVMSKLGMAGTNAEGLFFPDTYSFSRGSSDLELLRRANQRMQKLLAQEWDARAAGLPLKSAYEGLVLASVVEKETGNPNDRARIASVFVNRLRISMPLQSDPTVIYGLGSDFDGNLRKRDLVTDTPYNTYTRQGLPPTPISMPGLSALRAAFNPIQGNYLYFVSKGDGSSEFSRTLDEHNRAVTRYQKGGRK